MWEITVADFLIGLCVKTCIDHWKARKPGQATEKKELIVFAREPQALEKCCAISGLMAQGGLFKGSLSVKEDAHVFSMEDCDLFTAVGPYRLLSHLVRRDVVQSMQRREYQAGDLLMPEFGWVDHVGFLATGHAEVRMGTGTDEEAMVYNLYPGDYYGDLACLTDRISMVSVVCCEPSIIYLQCYEDFMYALDSHPALKLYFLKSAFHKFRHHYQVFRNGYDFRSIGGLPNAPMPKSVKKAVEFIEKNFDQQLTLTEVAQAAGLSKSAFSRRFKQFLGVSFKTYLNQMRVSKAKHFISSEGMNVTEACYAVGFNDTAYFSRMFRKIEGISPSFHKNGFK